MNAHRQLAVPHLVLPLVVLLQILEEIVGGGEAHFDGTVLLLDVIAQPVGGILALCVCLVLQGTASITARPDVLHGNGYAAL